MNSTNKGWALSAIKISWALGTPNMNSQAKSNGFVDAVCRRWRIQPPAAKSWRGGDVSPRLPHHTCNYQTNSQYKSQRHVSPFGSLGGGRQRHPQHGELDQWLVWQEGIYQHQFHIASVQKWRERELVITNLSLGRDRPFCGRATWERKDCEDLGDRQRPQPGVEREVQDRGGCSFQQFSSWSQTLGVPQSRYSWVWRPGQGSRHDGGNWKGHHLHQFYCSSS